MIPLWIFAISSGGITEAFENLSTRTPIIATPAIIATAIHQRNLKPLLKPFEPIDLLFLIGAIFPIYNNTIIT